MVGDEYDFWLFDLDGTVVDVDASYPRSVIGEVGDRLGCPFSEREAELLWYGVGGARSDVFASHEIDAETFWTTTPQRF